MDDILNKVEETAAFLKKKGFSGAATGVVLGTGLGALLHNLVIEKTISYSDIPHFPAATVEFHHGNLVLADAGGTKVILMQGRFHFYEGYSMAKITFPVRVLRRLGITSLLLSNAAGGMNRQYKKGDLVLIDDHINLLPENPLRGLNDPAIGNRFVDMSRPYSVPINSLIKKLAGESGIQLKEGIYVAVMGPNLETRAEYRYLRAAGADMVGMSTVPEVIVSNQLGLPCAAVSVITDECDPDQLAPVDISEIIAVAGQADLVLSRLFLQTIRALNNIPVGGN